MPQQKPIDPTPTKEIRSENEEDEITPYQFLNLVCGNAEDLSFTFWVAGNDTSPTTFQKQGDVCVETFITADMNNNPVSVREMEKDGKVHYIMDDYKTVKTYLAPAEDFILYKMMETAKTTPTLALEEGEYFLYEYTLPFIQDESISFKYRFYMKDGVLKKLTIALGNNPESVYEFSEFKQELINVKDFEYPKGYVEENFNHTYTGENMPPWWEIGNDE